MILLTFFMMTFIACQGVPLYTLELSEQDIAQKISGYFPINKTFYSLLHLKVNNPDIRLVEGTDRIKFSINLEARVGFLSTVYKGTSDVSGKLKYVKSKGTFYFTEPRIHRVDYPGFPRQYASQINQILTTLAKEFLNELPVYSFDTKNDGENFAKMALQKVTIKDKKLKIQLGIGD